MIDPALRVFKLRLNHSSHHIRVAAVTKRDCVLGIRPYTPPFTDTGAPCYAVAGAALQMVALLEP